MEKRELAITQFAIHMEPLQHGNRAAKLRYNAWLVVVEASNTGDESRNIFLDPKLAIWESIGDRIPWIHESACMVASQGKDSTPLAADRRFL